MTNSKKLIQITIQTIFVIVLIYFSTLNAKNLDKFGKADNISDYFSGILLLNESKYEESFNYLKKLDGLEDIHSSFPTKYLYSLVNSGNFSKAFNYSKKLERDGKGSYETDVILGVFTLKIKSLIFQINILKTQKEEFPDLLLITLYHSLYFFGQI